MESKDQKIKGLNAPIQCEIRRDHSAINPPAPGALGQAALAAAALRQLDRCAREIEAFVEASKMERLVEEIQADLNEKELSQSPRLRIRRDE